jgi:hypothetical protein
MNNIHSMEPSAPSVNSSVESIIFPLTAAGLDFKFIFENTCNDISKAKPLVIEMDYCKGERIAIFDNIIAYFIKVINDLIKKVTVTTDMVLNLFREGIDNSNHLDMFNGFPGIWDGLQQTFEDFSLANNNIDNILEDLRIKLCWRLVLFTTKCEQNAIVKFLETGNKEDINQKDLNILSNQRAINVAIYNIK